ncbi:MAG: AlpA family phage regulatory protein [Methyloprofundus sp.]|uniref:helix-turn-helix transcriptional regulator n=1 Tax=Thiomicrospira sp. TaxID=935 RepID=UPI001A0D1D50|nr:AlpA family phage regulatory protein [Methyloprofundus sp.]
MVEFIDEDAGLDSIPAERILELVLKHNQSPIMSVQEVCDFVKISKPVIYRMIKTGEFPPPLKTTQRQSAWFKHEVARWLATRRREVSPV